VTKADTSGVEADIDVLDEHGAVLLAVQGLRLGTSVSGGANKDRMLGERLLTIEWRQRELPDMEYADAGTWLLVSTTATADVVATALTDALKNHGAQCTSMCWPQHADYTSNAEQLGNYLRAGGFTGVVILTGPKNGDADDQSPLLGREYVQHLYHARITRDPRRAPATLCGDAQRPDGSGR
jgi:polyketide synthase 5